MVWNRKNAIFKWLWQKFVILSSLFGLWRWKGQPFHLALFSFSLVNSASQPAHRSTQHKITSLLIGSICIQFSWKLYYLWIYAKCVYSVAGSIYIFLYFLHDRIQVHALVALTFHSICSKKWGNYLDFMLSLFLSLDFVSFFALQVIRKIAMTWVDLKTVFSPSVERMQKRE